MNNIRHLILLLLLTSNLFGQTQTNNSLNAKLDGLYNTFFTKEGVGCVTLISKNGKIIYEKSFGKADIESNASASPESVFRIGSMTKQFTALAILQLYEQGKLDLNDEIQKFIPEFPIQNKKITIENLLTHTSGIKNLTEIEGLEIKQNPYTVKELIDLFKHKPLDFPTGDKYNYTNSGYILLGLIIEKISGKKYAEYISSNIFKKIGMANSFYDNSTIIIKNRAKGYDLDTTLKIVNTSFLNTTFPYAAGGLLMTVGDYFKWHQAIRSNKLIKKETLQKALTPFKLNDGTFTKYGYGWAFEDLLGSKAIEHGGYINGFTSKELYLPQEDILVVTFSNGSFVNINGLTDQAAAIVAAKPQLNVINVSDKIKKKYIGTYVFSKDNPSNLKIYEQKGKLFFKVSEEPLAWEIHFIKENEFICYEAFHISQILIKNKKGEIDYLIIKNFDFETKVMRVK